MFSCMLSLLVIRFCGNIADFGVRFLAAFLRAFRLWVSFGFVGLLHSRPWSGDMSMLHTTSGSAGSTGSSIALLTTGQAVTGAVTAGTAGATSTENTGEMVREGDLSWRVFPLPR